MYPILFWCDIYDSDESKMERRSGCTFADTYTEAMSNIEDYYGDEVANVKMEMLEECAIMEFVHFDEADAIVHAI